VAHSQGHGDKLDDFASGGPAPRAAARGYEIHIPVTSPLRAPVAASNGCVTHD
jgi:hypothetical protein